MFANGLNIMLICTQGGYNLTSISTSMAMCTSMLLGDAPPLLPPLPPPHPSANDSINNVLRAHAPYWRSLRIQSEAVAITGKCETNSLKKKKKMSTYFIFPSVLVPESLRLSLPSPKPKIKHTPAGKDKKPPAQVTPQQQHHRSAVPTSPASPPTDQEDSGLDELTQGLRSLDLSTSTISASSSPASVPVGGARPKVKPMQTDSSAVQEASPVRGLERGIEGGDVKSESTPIKQDKQVNHHPA